MRLAALALVLSACEKPAEQPIAPTSVAVTGSEPDATSPHPEDALGSDCRPTGCSGILCADADVMTTCEFKPEYACYSSATCTRQSDGACGWTKTPELDACLANPP